MWTTAGSGTGRMEEWDPPFRKGGQNGLCPFSSWQLFLRYCPIHHLGEILPALSGSSEDPLGGHRLRPDTWQWFVSTLLPLSPSGHELEEDRTTISLCAPCQPGIYQELLGHLLRLILCHTTGPEMERKKGLKSRSEEQTGGVENRPIAPQGP